MKRYFSEEELKKFWLDKISHIEDYFSQSRFNKDNIVNYSLIWLYNKAEKYFQRRREIDKQSISSFEDTIEFFTSNWYKEIERTDKWILFQITNNNACKIEWIRMHNCIWWYSNYESLYSLKEIKEDNKWNIYLKDYASIEGNKQFKWVCNTNVNINSEILKLKSLEKLINENEFKFKITIFDLELLIKKYWELKRSYFIFKERVIFEDFIIY